MWECRLPCLPTAAVPSLLPHEHHPRRLASPPALQPCAQACLALGVGLTIFKRICRKHGLHQWPYRSLKKQVVQAAARAMPAALYALRAAVVQSCSPWSWGTPHQIAEWGHHVRWPSPGSLGIPLFKLDWRPRPVMNSTPASPMPRLQRTMSRDGKLEGADILRIVTACRYPNVGSQQQQARQQSSPPLPLPELAPQPLQPSPLQRTEQHHHQEQQAAHASNPDVDSSGSSGSKVHRQQEEAGGNLEDICSVDSRQRKRRGSPLQQQVRRPPSPPQAQQPDMQGTRGAAGDSSHTRQQGLGGDRPASRLDVPLPSEAAAEADAGPEQDAQQQPPQQQPASTQTLPTMLPGLSLLLGPQLPTLQAVTAALSGAQHQSPGAEQAPAASQLQQTAEMLNQLADFLDAQARAAAGAALAGHVQRQQQQPATAAVGDEPCTAATLPNMRQPQLPSAWSAFSSPFNLPAGLQRQGQAAAAPSADLLISSLLNNAGWASGSLSLPLFGTGGSSSGSSNLSADSSVASAMASHLQLHALLEGLLAVSGKLFTPSDPGLPPPIRRELQPTGARQQK